MGRHYFRDSFHWLFHMGSSICRDRLQELDTCKARTGIYKVIAKPSRAGSRVACRIMTVRAGSGPMRGAVRRDGGLLGASE
jgi:hypothetical protein